jgi:translation initiation factor 2 subunit 3
VELLGGVIGGSRVQGQLADGDTSELRPGREADDGWTPVETTVRSLRAGNESVESVTPGGLLGVGTGLDPSYAKGDALAGQIAGPPGTLPETREAFTMDVRLLDRVVGDDGGDVDEISTGEPLMLTVGTATTVGSVTSARGDVCEVRLKRPVCAADDARIAINRRVGSRWRLIGVGTLRE